MKRVLSLLLAVTLLTGSLWVLASCGQTSDDPLNETSSQTQEETETEKPLAYDTVEKKKYNRSFAILCRNDTDADFKVEKLSGDLLDDMIFERNTQIATDFGVDIGFYEMGYADVNKTLNTQATSGTDDYDLYTGHKYSFGTCVQNNYCYDLAQIDEIDLTQPWWDQACRENTTVNGHTFMMTGDIFPSSMLISSCIAFNRKMIKDMGKSDTDLFAMARSGDWTMDVMYEYGKDVTFDLNGDGKIVYTDDRFSLSSWKMDVPFSMYYACDENFITIQDGTPELTYDAQKVVDIYEKIYKIIIEQKAYFVTDGNLYPTTYEVFSAGRAMFCDITLNKISHNLTEMDDPYGILPMPKFDKAQDEYLSFVNGSSPMVMIAKTEADPAFVGTIVEAMATHNYDRLTPKLFQVITKLQAAQDPDSSSMVDYIIRNRVHDLAYMADFPISNVVLEGLKAGRESIASLMTSAGRTSNNLLKRIVKSFDNFK